MSIAEQLLAQLEKLDASQQQRVLNFARTLSKTPAIKGESGQSIIAATGFFDAQSLDEMEAAILEGCGSQKISP